jgi:hypothetical protein
MRYFLFAWILLSVSIVVQGRNAFGFGGGRAQETVQEVTELVNDVRDFYHGATNYYYGNTHIHLSPSLSNPSVTVTYTFRSSPVRVTLVHKTTKKILGVRMVRMQERVFKSVPEVLGDKQVDEKFKARFKSEILPLQEQVMGEVRKVALELQDLVKQKKMTSDVAAAQFKERFLALVKKAVGRYPEVVVR